MNKTTRYHPIFGAPEQRIWPRIIIHCVSCITHSFETWFPVIWRRIFSPVSAEVKCCSRPTLASLTHACGTFLLLQLVQGSMCLFHLVLRLLQLPHLSLVHLPASERNRSFVWDTAQQLFNTFYARKLSIAIIRMVVVGWVKWMIMYYNPNFPHPTPPNKLFLTIQAFLLPAKICPDQRNLCINSILFSRTLSLFPTSTALP